mgnify:CR=1 FL=1
MLPPDLAGLYLGGGYPELHAKALSGNTAFREALFHIRVGQGFLDLLVQPGNHGGRRFGGGGQCVRALRALAIDAVIGISGWEIAQSLVEAGGAEFISNPEDLGARLDSIPVATNPHAFYAPRRAVDLSRY